MKFPVIISTNCSGANFYHNYLNLQFYSPFIWSVTPYSSIIKIINGWNKINWLNFEIIKNKTRDLTYTLIIDNSIFVNYVHYFYSDKYIMPYHKGASVFSKNIIDFIKLKYTERTNRMLEYGNIKTPYFIVHEEEYSNENNKNGIKEICEIKSDFRRCVISHDILNCKRDKNVKIIKTAEKMLPQPMIEMYGKDIQKWFKIDDSIIFTNNISLNDTTNHQ